MIEEKEERIEFRFAGLQIMSKQMNLWPEGKQAPTLFSYEIKIETKIQVEQGMVIENVLVAIRDSENSENICASFSVWCFFQVMEFQKFIKLNEQGLHDVPEILQNTIRPVSISTVRGIIYSDLKNTYLQNTIMPVVYMDAFKEEKLQLPELPLLNNSLPKPKKQRKEQKKNL